jgi:hypothetical protein
MKFRPGLPEHNDNISHSHPLKEFFVLLGGLGLIVLAIYLILGLCVDLIAENISPEQEQRWFKRSAIDVLASSAVTHGGQSTGIELPLFDELKACAGIDYSLKLWQVESEVVNAVAVPGGDIFIYRGLIDKLESENGLAFVLAHEIAHFQQRDHLKGLGRGLVLASIMAFIGMGDVASLAHPATALGQAQYSQSRESSADERALAVLDCHYGHVSGATEFFEAMLLQNEAAPKFAHYFSSHPELRARIDQISTLVKRHQYVYGDTTALPSLTH